MLKARWQNSYPIRELEQCDHVGHLVRILRISRQQWQIL